VFKDHRPSGAKTFSADGDWVFASPLKFGRLPGLIHGCGGAAKLMRHASITTTMNIYGDVVTNEMAEAHGKVVQLVLSKQ
jgi:hypothetical protein